MKRFVWLLVTAGSLAAQTLSYVASVKPNNAVDARALNEFTPGGRFTATATTVANLIRSAYRIQGYQLVGAPGWFSTRRYDILVKADENPAPTQQTLLRALLKDQFGLAVHEETREMPVFELVLARSDGRPGPKLVKSDFDCAAYRAAPHAAPEARGAVLCGARSNSGSFSGKAVAISQLAASLGFFAGRFVIDKTGLVGGYDMDLRWTPDEAARDADGPSLFTALQEQLGLKLVAERGPVNVLVVDGAAEPVASDRDPVATPKFEVATIKVDKNCAPGTRSGGDRARGRLTLRCQPLTGLITSAYLGFANARFTTQARTEPISGLPSWADSELYDVNAKAEGVPSEEMMRGPMLQALLEDRFKLRIHRQTTTIPVYALVQSGRGLKIRPFQKGSCIPVDRSRFPPPPATEKSCHARGRREGSLQIVDAQAMTVSEFSNIFLNGALDRPVIDKTGIAGTYDFHLEYGIDQATPRFLSGAGDSVGPSIFTAVRGQLGLRLQPTTGSGESLVIDHVERPSEN